MRKWLDPKLGDCLIITNANEKPTISNRSNVTFNFSDAQLKKQKCSVDLLR